MSKLSSFVSFCSESVFLPKIGPWIYMYLPYPLASMYPHFPLRSAYTLFLFDLHMSFFPSWIYFQYVALFSFYIYVSAVSPGFHVSPFPLLDLHISLSPLRSAYVISPLYLHMPHSPWISIFPSPLYLLMSPFHLWIYMCPFLWWIYISSPIPLGPVCWQIIDFLRLKVRKPNILLEMWMAFNLVISFHNSFRGSRFVNYWGLVSRLQAGCHTLLHRSLYIGIWPPETVCKYHIADNFYLELLPLNSLKLSSDCHLIVSYLPDIPPFTPLKTKNMYITTICNNNFYYHSEH